MKRGSKKRASHEELRDDELKETSKTVQGSSKLKGNKQNSGYKKEKKSSAIIPLKPRGKPSRNASEKKQERSQSEDMGESKKRKKKKENKKKDRSKIKQSREEKLKETTREPDETKSIAEINQSVHSLVPQQGSYEFTREQRQQSKAAKKAQVKVFVESTLKKGVQGLVAEFRSMKRVNDFTKMTEFVAQNAQGRNRYKDVGCLDQTRVVISLGPSPYIHANYVSTPNNERRFICTQAPLPRTCAEFWYMVVQERAVAILMLCNFVEMGAKKCAEYYPQQANEIMVFDEDVTVIFKKQEPFKLPFESKVHIMMTTLEVNIRGQQPHSCIHYHWMDWPDRGVPEADLAPIFLLNKLKDSKAPIVVHCSAGIGRTGSIVLIQHAMELLNKPAPLLEISGYLEQLRMQRNNSIQTEQQYLYVHEVLLLYLKKTKYLDDALNEHLEKFARDYIKATTGF